MRVKVTFTAGALTFVVCCEYARIEDDHKLSLCNMTDPSPECCHSVVVFREPLVKFDRIEMEVRDITDRTFHRIQIEHREVVEGFPRVAEDCRITNATIMQNVLNYGRYTK